MAQISYVIRPGTAHEGVLEGQYYLSVSGSNKGVVNFGKAVKFADEDGYYDPLSANTDKVAGVVIWEAKPDGNILTSNDTIGILRQGLIWVNVEDAFVRGDGAYVRAVATGDEVEGNFRASADGTDTIDLTAKTQFLTSGQANSLGLLAITL